MAGLTTRLGTLHKLKQKILDEICSMLADTLQRIKGEIRIHMYNRGRHACHGQTF